MSVVIKGMKMPENCYGCPCCDEDPECYYDSYCRAGSGWNEDPMNPKTDKRPSDCPLVELPEKHGRLIDADKLKEDSEWYYDDFLDEKTWAVPEDCIDQASTVLGAED